MKRILGIILAVAGVAVLAISLISQVSVWVIDGKDGPASISVAGKIGGVPAIIGMLSGVVLAVAGIFMLLSKNKFRF